jgi:hypothetical protein
LETLKIIRPDAPWLKDEIDEFEDLKEGELESFRQQISDKALISAVKASAELSRA